MLENEDKQANPLFLRVYLSAYKSGLVAQLGATNWVVFETICTYMNEEGVCWPTQEQIAERSGVSVLTVNRAVKKLLAFRFNDKPIISRKKVQTGYYKNSVYTVHPISQVAIFGGQVEAVEEVSTFVSTNVSTKDKAAQPDYNAAEKDETLNRLAARLQKQ